MNRKKEISLDPKKLSERDNYKLLTGSIIPRPVALVTTMEMEGILNLAPFSYFNIVATDPAIISISIQRNEDELKDTAENIIKTKQAVVHIVDIENVKDANKTAAKLDSDQSELDLTALHLVSSTVVDVPAVNESKVRFETSLVEVVPIKNDEGKITADLFLLKVEYYHVNEGVYKMGKIDPLKLRSVSRLGGNEYAEVGEIFELERPE